MSAAINAAMNPAVTHPNPAKLADLPGNGCRLMPTSEVCPTPSAEQVLWNQRRPHATAALGQWPFVADSVQRTERAHCHGIHEHQHGRLLHEFMDGDPAGPGHRVQRRAGNECRPDRARRARRARRAQCSRNLPRSGRSQRAAGFTSRAALHPGFSLHRRRNSRWRDGFGHRAHVIAGNARHIFPPDDGRPPNFPGEWNPHRAVGEVRAASHRQGTAARGSAPCIHPGLIRGPSGHRARRDRRSRLRNPVPGKQRDRAADDRPEHHRDPGEHPRAAHGSRRSSRVEYQDAVHRGLLHDRYANASRARHKNPKLRAR